MNELVKNKLDDSEREEGEIIDISEFEDISSDEENFLRNRIKELEARNVELEQIASISSRSYDYGSLASGTQKRQKLGNTTSDNVNRQKLPTTTSSTSATGTGIKTAIQQQTSRHQNISTRRSRKRSSSLISTNKYKRNEKSTTKIQQEKYRKTKKRKTEKRSKDIIRPTKYHYTSSDESDVPICRNALAAAIDTDRNIKKYNRNGTTDITPRISSEEDENVLKLRLEALKSKIELKTVLNKTDDDNLLEEVIQTSTNYVNDYDDDEIFNNKIIEDSNENVTNENEKKFLRKDEFTNEEQELRIIALKSAVVKKYEARKKRKEIKANEERPYSPTDIVEKIEITISSPIGTTGTDYSEDNMDISPILSPISDEYKEIDMEIALSENSKSPINYNYIHKENNNDEYYQQLIINNNNEEIRKIELINHSNVPSYSSPQSLTTTTKVTTTTNDNNLQIPNSSKLINNFDEIINTKIDDNPIDISLEADCLRSLLLSSLDKKFNAKKDAPPSAPPTPPPPPSFSINPPEELIIPTTLKINNNHIHDIHNNHINDDNDFLKNNETKICDNLTIKLNTNTNIKQIIKKVQNNTNIKLKKPSILKTSSSSLLSSSSSSSTLSSSLKIQQKDQQKIVKKLINNTSSLKSVPSPPSSSLIIPIPSISQIVAQPIPTVRKLIQTEPKKIPRFIIQLGNSDSSDDDHLIGNLKGNEKENIDKKQLIKSIQTTTSITTTTTTTATGLTTDKDNNKMKIDDGDDDELIVKDGFEEKLNEFLKNARSKIEQKQMIKVGNNNATIKSIKMNKIQSNTTPLAVRHLPPSSQMEYKKLVTRMNLLEKQKQLRHPNKIINNNSNTTTIAAATTILKNNLLKTAIATTSSINNIRKTSILTKVTKPKITTPVKSATINKIMLNDVTTTTTAPTAAVSTTTSTSTVGATTISSTISKQTPTLVSPKRKLSNDVSLTNNLLSNSLNTINNNSQEQQQLQKLQQQKVDEKYEKILKCLPKLTNEKQHDILNRSEEEYTQHSAIFISDLDNILELIYKAQKEREKQFLVENEMKQLKKKLQEMEKISFEQKEILTNLFPKISSSHKIILKSRNKCNKLNQFCVKVGKIVKGEDYRLSTQRTGSILGKLKILSSESKKLKNMKISDVVQQQQQPQEEKQMEQQLPSDDGTINNDEQIGEINTNIKEYKSPLEHMKTDLVKNPNGVICPFELGGKCEDECCLYEHLQ